MKRRLRCRHDSEAQAARRHQSNVQSCRLRRCVACLEGTCSTQKVTARKTRNLAEALPRHTISGERWGDPHAIRERCIGNPGICKGGTWDLQFERVAKVVLANPVLEPS